MAARRALGSRAAVSLGEETSTVVGEFVDRVRGGLHAQLVQLAAGEHRHCRIHELLAALFPRQPGSVLARHVTNITAPLYSRRTIATVALHSRESRGEHDDCG